MPFVPDQQQPRSRFVPDEPSQPVGMGSGLLNAFGQGLSLGTADEMTAAGSALTGGNYGDSMRSQQQAREQFQGEHPLLAGTATAAGAVAPVVASTIMGGPVGGAASGTTAAAMVRNALMGRAFQSAPSTAAAMGQGMRYGVGIGAPAGYASAEPGKRGTGAVQGAAAGAALGAGIPAAMGAWGQLSPRLAKWGDIAAPKLQQVAESIGVQAGPTVSNAVPANRLPAALTGDRIPPPGSAAEAKLLRALQEGGISPEAAGAALEHARTANVPLSLMDVGGQPMSRLARGTRTLPGSGSAKIDAALDERTAGQPARVKDAVETGIGQPIGGNAGATSDLLLRQAREQSSPYYQQLAAMPIQDHHAMRLFNTPGARNILTAIEQARTAFELPTAPGLRPLYNPDKTLARAPTMADVNDLNVTINEMMSPAYERMGGRPIEGINLATQEGRNLANQFRRELNRLVEDLPGGDIYRTARANYAGPADARTHYERGLEFTNPNTPIEDVTAQMRDTTPVQQQWYKSGAADAIGQRIDQMPDLGQRPNVLRSFWGNPNARQRMDVLTGDRAPALNDRLELENIAAQNSNYIRGGSQTADKAAEAIDVAADITDKVVGGRSPATVAAQAIWNRVRGQFGQDTRDEIARMLVEVDPAKQQAIIQRLALLNAQGKLRADQVGRIVRAATIQQQN
jgi:hypothetical protein